MGITGTGNARDPIGAGKTKTGQTFLGVWFVPSPSVPRAAYSFTLIMEAVVSSEI